MWQQAGHDETLWSPRVNHRNMLPLHESTVISQSVNMVIISRHFHGYHLSPNGVHHIPSPMSASSDHRSTTNWPLIYSEYEASFSMYLIQLSNLFFNVKFYGSHRRNREKRREIAKRCTHDACIDLPRWSFLLLMFTLMLMLILKLMWKDEISKQNMHKDSKKKISHTMRFSQCFRLHARWSDLGKTFSKWKTNLDSWDEIVQKHKTYFLCFFHLNLRSSKRINSIVHEGRLCQKRSFDYIHETKLSCYDTKHGYGRRKWNQMKTSARTSLE